MKAKVEGRAKRIFVNVQSMQKFSTLLTSKVVKLSCLKKKSFFDDIVDDVDDNDDNYIAGDMQSSP